MCGDALQLQPQLFKVEGLGHVVVSAKFHGLHGRLHRSEAGHHNDDRIGPAALDLAIISSPLLPGNG